MRKFTFLLKKISISFLKKLKIYEKNPKLHFQIIKNLRGMLLYFYSLFPGSKLENYFYISGAYKWTDFPEIYSNLKNFLDKDKVKKVLEIGVGGHNLDFGGGKSLQALSYYFKKAQIIGVDICDKSYIDKGNLKTVLCDQNNVQELENLGSKYGKFDLIIDDGSHFVEHQMTSFKVLFKYLKDNGIYIIEDVGSSYRTSFGGDANLGQGKNLISYFSRFSHSVNSEMLIDDKLNELSDMKNISYLAFANKVIFLQKRVKSHLSYKDQNKPHDFRKTEQGFIDLKKFKNIK